VRSDSLAEHLRRRQRGTSRSDRRAAVPLDGEDSRNKSDECYEKIDEKRYETNPFRAPTRLTADMVSASRRRETKEHFTAHADAD
jgi:hypothetical protein